MSVPEGGVAWGRAIGWGLFLACSWTWCLGMWLPVYLARDFGWPGWVAFLVPNVIGAAAMGLVLRRESSAALVRRHAAAMRAFSLVTILFHVSFLSWWLSWAAAATPARKGWIGGLVAWAVVVAGLVCARGGGWIGRAAAVYALSVIAWLASWAAGSTLAPPPLEGEHGLGALALAWPVFVFGFMLSPYLDATFHRARQARAGAAGSAAFILGFGVFFLALMVYSLLYAGGWLSRSFSYYLVAHVAAQSWFTISAHAREVLGGGLVDESATHRGRAVMLVALALLAAGSAALPWLPDLRPGVPATRFAYELFLAAYALPVPAYVWVVVIERGIAWRARIAGWIVACVLAAPFLWMGFVERRFEWIPVAVGIPLVAPIVVKLLARRSRF